MTGQVAAELLGRHPDLVYRWLRKGRLRGKKFGPVWMVSDAELARFRRQEPQRRQRGELE